MGKILAIILLTSLFLNSCGLSVHERKEIREIVFKYNRALITAYETEDFDLLRDVTTDQEFKKVMVYIQSYAAVGEKIRAILKDIKIKAIKKRDERTVDVFTSEKWQYQRIELDTGKTIVPETLYEYEMRYEIIKNNNKWKVASLNVLREEKR